MKTIQRKGSRIPEDWRDELGLEPWVVACERGTRSAEAVRWVTQQGISATYLGGGPRWRALAQGETA